MIGHKNRFVVAFLQFYQHEFCRQIRIHHYSDVTLHQIRINGHFSLLNQHEFSSFHKLYKHIYRVVFAFLWYKNMDSAVKNRFVIAFLCQHGFYCQKRICRHFSELNHPGILLSFHIKIGFTFLCYIHTDFTVKKGIRLCLFWYKNTDSAVKNGLVIAILY